VQVIAAYLNLIAAQRITKSQQKNLERAIVFRNNTITRAKNGLIAGVDSSLANAEVSGAKIELTKAKDGEQEESSKLAVLIGVSYTEFILDTAFISRIPKAILEPAAVSKTLHPVLGYYQSKIDLSNEQTK
jgi:outer membrane protein TolC